MNKVLSALVLVNICTHRCSIVRVAGGVERDGVDSILAHEGIIEASEGVKDAIGFLENAVKDAIGFLENAVKDAIGFIENTIVTNNDDDRFRYNRHGRYWCNIHKAANVATYITDTFLPDEAGG